MTEPLLIDPNTLSVFLSLNHNAEVRAILAELGIALPEENANATDGEMDEGVSICFLQAGVSPEGDA